jgi:hypothetical protein
MAHRTNRVLTILFAMLFLVNVSRVLVGFASLPLYYQRVTTLTVPPNTTTNNTYPTNESVAAGAAARALSLEQYAGFQVIYHSAIALLCSAVAFLIVWRARWNWFAWFSAFILMFVADYALYRPVYVAQLLPMWLYESGALYWPLVLLYIYLFPNGKPVPRVALWVIAPALAFHFGAQALGFYAVVFNDAALAAFFQNSLGFVEWVIVAVFLVILGCQVYRYFRVSTREERQQTKWFIYGFIFFLGLSTVTETFADANPYAEEMNLLIFVFLPLSIGVAILRYRLWDIDILIRRTLTYAIVVALLGMIYFGSVILLQQLFASVTGQRSEVITVLSTLAIAALFVPLRGRVQAEIDKRFNRKKYNAQQVLSDFSNTVRDETNLENLTARLVQVVDETMQPKSVSVWLKGPYKK